MQVNGKPPHPTLFLLSLMTGMVGWNASMCFNDGEKDFNWMPGSHLQLLLSGSHLQLLLVQLGDGPIQYDSMDTVW